MAAMVRGRTRAVNRDPGTRPIGAPDSPRAQPNCQPPGAGVLVVTVTLGDPVTDWSTTGELVAAAPLGVVLMPGAVLPAPGLAGGVLDAALVVGALDVVGALEVAGAREVEAAVVVGGDDEAAELLGVEALVVGVPAAVVAAVLAGREVLGAAGLCDDLGRYSRYPPAANTISRSSAAMYHPAREPPVGG
jgi:hypothetical protein